MGANPPRGTRYAIVVIPKGKPMGHCHAYSIDEIQTMLKVLPEPARTAVLVAALTGIRHSEIRGLKWEDIVGDELYVRRSVWNTHVGDTKTGRAMPPVPLLPVLSKALKRHRKTSHCEYIFAGRSSKPLFSQTSSVGTSNLLSQRRR